MASTYGRKFKITLDGTSHGPFISIAIKGVEKGTQIELEEIKKMLLERSPKNKIGVTERVEEDDFEIESGINLLGGHCVADGNEIRVKIFNKDIDSSKYDKFKDVPRPGHADYTSIMKDGENAEIAGGGRFSGRLTVGLSFAGSIAIQILRRSGIEVSAKIDEIYGMTNSEDMGRAIYEAKMAGDSVGGVVKVEIKGLEPGSAGNSYFEGLEGRISEAIFGIPAVKGIEFGSGFKGSRLRGSENNDEFYFDEDGDVKTYTNNHGGILGGIASGMPITFRVAFKPTPSISRPQRSVNLATLKDEEIVIEGRHDPCVVIRALSVVRSMAAVAVLDSILVARDEEKKETIDEYRRIINDQNDIILGAFLKRLEAAREIAKLKREKGLPIRDLNREDEIITDIRNKTPKLMQNYTEELFKDIMDITSKSEENLLRRPYGLLGRHLTHSLSPMIHNIISKETAVDYEYRLYEKEPDEIESFLKSGEFEGLNVTIPYKETVIPFLDELTEEAREIGAVNTIYRKGNLLVGDNTDAKGFEISLREKKIATYGAKCLILGAGGASKAAEYVLARNGAKSIKVLSHEDIDNGEIEKLLDIDILINATPVGMYPMEGLTLAKTSEFFDLKFVFDMIYNPYRTELIKDAKLNGINHDNGLNMLIIQAIKSAEDFLGEDLDLARLSAKIKEEMPKDDLNIVLIGMPGVGKTTIGKVLSEITGREFFDTDEMVEYRTGLKPKEIIERMGEDTFRNYEEDAVTVLKSAKGKVIALGGGTIKRDANYYELASRSIFFYLERDLSTLEVADRPLSSAKSIEAIYMERKKKYDRWKDFEVEIDGKDALESANEILEIFRKG